VPDEILFASLMAESAASFCRDLSAYLAGRLDLTIRMLDELPWQERERRLYRGDAHVGVVCGLQYVYAVDRRERPGVELLCAPVMRGDRYRDQPIYFSDVVVRRDSPAASLADLRGATWAYNEPTSHSGYNLPRYVLAVRGEPLGFFGRLVESGAHKHSLELILNETVDASAIDSTVLEQELRMCPELADRLRVIETLGPSPIPPLVISRVVAPPLRAALANLLLEMHHDSEGARVLSAASVTRFVAVCDADYDPIRRILRTACALVEALSS
jgi:phosphonate transport system substrate-binding protein